MSLRLVLRLRVYTPLSHRRGAGGEAFLTLHGQHDGEGGALALNALGADGAVHGLDHESHQRQAHAGAHVALLHVTLEEGVEDVWQRLGLDAPAGVEDLYLHTVGAALLQRDVDLAVGGCVLDGVGDEVRHDLLHVVGHEVHVERSQRVGEGQLLALALGV